jgi:hypothetical protein
VVGDTVGDPFKDTSGPSMNILINVMAIVSLVIAPLALIAAEKQKRGHQAPFLMLGLSYLLPMLRVTLTLKYPERRQHDLRRQHLLPARHACHTRAHDLEHLGFT